MNKVKILLIALIAFSLIGYLEWGQGQHSFIFQMEGEIIRKLFSDPLSVLHPFALLPLFGQLLLIIPLFQNKPNKIITIIGIGGISLLFLLLLLIGIMGGNWKMILFSLPFLGTALAMLRELRKAG